MSTNTNNARIVHNTQFDGRGHTNENSLAYAYLTKPDKISPIITHLMGREEDKFPLTFLTEGQKGGQRSIEISDIQYEWDVINRLRKADAIAVTSYTSGTPGINNQPFTLLMKTNWLKKGLVVTQSGVTLKCLGNGTPAGQFYLYTFETTDINPLAYVPLSDLVAGAKLAASGGNPVSESMSFGNSSNVVTPGRMKNQLSVLRKSYRLGGNIANKVTEFQFNVNGVQSKLWIDFERYQHMINWKQEVEEHLWYSNYNRRADGSIVNKDPETGLPTPMGAGVIDQIPNSDTYAVLTATKIKQVVGDVMYGAPDKKNVTIVLYTGLDGLDQFDTAMKGSLQTSGFTTINKDMFVSGAGRNLVLGGFFTGYQHVDGHSIIVKHLPLLDYGGRAESARLHPISGRPFTSSEMYFLDQSDYDGEKNIQMVTQKGRSEIMRVVKGMSPLPSDLQGNDTQSIATEQDVSSVHFMKTFGVCIRRNTHCFKLLTVMS